MPSIFQYPVTRQFTLPHFTLGVIILGLLWTTFITIINFAVVGYDTVSLASSSFNSSDNYWYEKLPLASSWFPKSWTCSPSSIQRGQGEAIVARKLTKAQDLVTSSGIFTYSLVEFEDENSNSSVFGGLSYSNTPIRECGIEDIVATDDISQQGKPLAWSVKFL